MTSTSKAVRDPGRGPMRRGFTLIEMLVVIAIITVLMSILLPVLRKVRTVAGQGMCAKQIHTITQAVHAYVIDENDKLPLTTGTANWPSWMAWDVYLQMPIGLGLIWQGKYLDDSDVFFCPAGEGDDNWRLSSKEQFSALLDRGGMQYVSTDYSLAYFSAPVSICGDTGYTQYPIAAPKDTLEDFKSIYVAYLSDRRSREGPVLPPQYSTHNSYKYTNFGLLDGSTRSAMDVWDNQPTASQIRSEGVDTGSCRGDYWFLNSHGMWLFWRWYGPGFGL